MARFRGGSQRLTPVVDFFLRPQLKRLVIVVTSTAGLKGKLPQATRYRITGGDIGTIFNLGTVSFDIVDWDGNVVHTLAINKVAVVVLTDNTTDAGEWWVLEYDVAA